MRMNRWLAVVILLGSSVAMADGLKNAQVLPKDMSKEQVRDIMKAQAKALGVDCDHCHEVPDMASDAKDAKKAARVMMKMTAEINEKWLKQVKGAEKEKVTCGTCHQGHAEPPKFGGK